MAVEGTEADAGAQAKVTMRTYEVLVETYRHHLDVFFKLTALYLALVGVAAGYVFGEGTTTDQRVALLGFVSIISAAGAIANLFVIGWGRDLEEKINFAAKNLSVRPLSLGAARALVILIISVLSVITLLSVFLMRRELSG